MAQPTQAASLIAALHARYEATQSEYSTIECADTPQAKQRQNTSYVHHFDTALLTSEREADALRNVILYQVPDSWSDALILQYHIVVAHDAHAAASKPKEEDGERLQIAIDTLFDFMCTEVRADAGEIGATFKDAAASVFRARRLRTGVVEA